MDLQSKRPTCLDHRRIEGHRPRHRAGAGRRRLRTASRCPRPRRNWNALADELAAAGLPRPRVHALDLSVRGAPAALAEACGPLDILVNNAGAIPRGDVGVGRRGSVARRVGVEGLRHDRPEPRRARRHARPPAWRDRQRHRPGRRTPERRLHRRFHGQRGADGVHARRGWLVDRQMASGSWASTPDWSIRNDWSRSCAPRRHSVLVMRSVGASARTRASCRQAALLNPERSPTWWRSSPPIAPAT